MGCAKGKKWATTRARTRDGCSHATARVTCVNIPFPILSLPLPFSTSYPLLSPSVRAILFARVLAIFLASNRRVSSHVTRPLGRFSDHLLSGPLSNRKWLSLGHTSAQSPQSVIVYLCKDARACGHDLVIFSLFRVSTSARSVSFGPVPICARLARTSTTNISERIAINRVGKCTRYSTRMRLDI